MWMALISLVFIAGGGFVVYRFNSQFSARDKVIERSAKAIEGEVAVKKDIIDSLAGLSLGLVSKDRCSELEAKLAEIQEALKAEEGRFTLTEAELEAVDRRLRDLDELKRELEVSALDAQREMETLQAQEAELKELLDGLRGQLHQSVSEIDNLLQELASSTEAVERLNSAKQELLQVEKNSEQYEEQVRKLNQKYMDLKRAYDALDIEYAQLYERQNAM